MKACLHAVREESRRQRLRVRAHQHEVSTLREQPAAQRQGHCRRERCRRHCAFGHPQSAVSAAVAKPRTTRLRTAAHVQQTGGKFLGMLSIGTLVFRASVNDCARSAATGSRRLYA